MRTEVKAILEVSSFLFNIGDIKNKKNNPLKANILLAPTKNILLAPFAKSGRECSNLNKSTTKINVNTILISVIGTIIVFVLIIDFFPRKLAKIPIKRKINKKNAIG